MKTITKIISALFMGAAITANAADANGWATTNESLSAFYKSSGRAGYVKPIVDNIGNVLNSNWYASSSVPKSFAFEAGLPFSLIPIGDDDRKYTVTALGISTDIPTIFGDKGQPAIPGVIYGNETLNSLPLFTYPYLQLAASYFNARIVLRGMWLPPISELKGFSLLGAGFQYSFGHFFQNKLPLVLQPLDVSAVFGYSSSTIKYQPKEHSSPLILDLTGITADVVIGYKPLPIMEVMLTLGYQYANMEASGKSSALAPNYDLSVEGNSGFKFGLEVAFTVGNSFHPVVGFDYAGKSSFTTNVLYFQQQFGKE